MTGLARATVLYQPSDGTNLLSAVSRGVDAVTTRIKCCVQSVNKGDETKVHSPHKPVFARASLAVHYILYVIRV